MESSLLDDLDELGSDDEDNGGAGGPTVGEDEQLAARAENGEDDEEKEDDDGAADASSAENAVPTELPQDAELDAQLATLVGRAGFRSVAKLRETRRFQDHLARIAVATAQSSSALTAPGAEADAEYRLIVASNQIVAALDDEVVALHRYIVDGYRRRFPELESVIPSPLDYIRAVRAIGNETDLTLVDLAAVPLPSATVMLVTVAGSATTGRVLPAAELADVMAACDEVAALEAGKGAVLAFLQSRMAAAAPAVCALTGSRLAATLVGIAGGLPQLSRIPASNMMLLGHRRRALAGLGRHGSGGAGGSAAGGGIPHVGVLQDCDLVVAAPPNLRRRAAKVLAAKVALCARIDAFGAAVVPAGAAGSVGGRSAAASVAASAAMRAARGAAFRDEVAARVAKWQEPPPGKAKRPLPAPDEARGKRRGGRRARLRKARLGITDVRKEANRTAFGTGGGGGGGGSGGAEYGDAVMGLDTGMLGGGGGAGSGGRLRLERKEQKLTTKRRRLEGQYTGPGGSSGATGGAASSLAFTAQQGIELVNPAAAAERLRKANEDFAAAGYFSSLGAAAATSAGAGGGVGLLARGGVSFGPGGGGGAGGLLTGR